MPLKINIVWFKRDLRLTDHEPLRAALQSDLPILLLYIFEPSLQEDDHYHKRHWRFIEESLREMNEEFRPYDTKIHVVQGEALEVFSRLLTKFEVHTVFSHMETGLRITYDRDLACKSYFHRQGIRWMEFQNGGVVRGLRNRRTWEKEWYIFMEKPIHQIDLSAGTWMNSSLPEVMEYPLQNSRTNSSGLQLGGSKNGWKYLNSFIRERHTSYMKNISSPSRSREHSSRISPYLAWGNLSSREAYQAVESISKSNRNIRAFRERLRWRCHFIQKFEMEDEMEFRHVNRGFQKVEYIRDAAMLEAWKKGMTGYPMVDASMRCLIKTGFLNFRMRAMLVSFLTHHLFMHWKAGSAWLASLFLDFEPGIHFSQMQMQAGVTGINTLRIYNPVKQAEDHDPTGSFVREWVPELAHLPLAYLHKPWTMTPLEAAMYRFDLERDYYPPVVPPHELGRIAREVLWGMRDDAIVQQEGRRIVAKLTNPGRRNV